MNQMPKDGGVTGLEGLGKIPLMYQMGVDSANAKAFDEQKAIEENQQVQGVMDYQRQKDMQAQKNQSMEQYLKLAQIDAEAANQFAKDDPMASQVIPPSVILKEKMDKNGWLTFEQLNADGTQKDTTAINLGGMPQAQATLKAKGILQPTLDQIAEAMPPGWAIKTSGASKPADNKDPKVTGHLVRDPESSTGYSYLGDDGEIMAQNAPTPAELHPRPVGGDSDAADAKDFRALTNKLDGLRKAEASIQRGVDPFTGAVIPPTNINNALSTLRGQISDTERYIASEHPERWSRYRKPAVSGDTVSSHGAPAPAATAAPMTATNPKTGQRIISYDGGQTWQ
jgi:hypothetical protein